MTQYSYTFPNDHHDKCSLIVFRKSLCLPKKIKRLDHRLRITSCDYFSRWGRAPTQLDSPLVRAVQGLFGTAPEYIITAHHQGLFSKPTHGAPPGSSCFSNHFPGSGQWCLASLDLFRSTSAFPDFQIFLYAKSPHCFFKLATKSKFSSAEILFLLTQGQRELSLQNPQLPGLCFLERKGVVCIPSFF